MLEDAPDRITLWKNNRVDQQWRIGFDELLDRFEASPRFGRLTGRGFEFALSQWIGDTADDGLASIWDVENRDGLRGEFEALVDRAWDRGTVTRWCTAQAKAEAAS